MAQEVAGSSPVIHPISNSLLHPTFGLEFFYFRRKSRSHADICNFLASPPYALGFLCERSPATAFSQNTIFSASKTESWVWALERVLKPRIKSGSISGFISNSKISQLWLMYRYNISYRFAQYSDACRATSTF